MILNTQSNAKRPLITNLAGHEITNFEFTFDDDTEVSYSCPLLWKNENFIIGGWGTSELRRQVSKVDGCGLKLIGLLPFEHKWGSCANVNDVKVYLCFSHDDRNVCRVAPVPVGPYKVIEMSNFEHRFAHIAAAEGEIFETNDITYILF